MPGLWVSVAGGVYAYFADAQSSDALYESLTIVWSAFTLVWAFALRKAWQRRESMLGSRVQTLAPGADLATGLPCAERRLLPLFVAPKTLAVAALERLGPRALRPSLDTLPSAYTQPTLRLG